jgi:isopropylmalate/homocitrate/citramalate synthase
LKQRAEDLGFQLSRQELEEVYNRFTQMADNKKGLRNDEIVALIELVMGSGESHAHVPATVGTDC